MYACTPRICAGLDIDPYGGYIFTDDIDEDINIVGSGLIQNYGILRGNITIGSGFMVTFQNFGQITSNFNVAVPDMVEQYITSVDDLHVLGNLSGNTVNVNVLNSDGTKNIIDMADFISFIAGASSVEVESGAFTVGANVPDNSVQINVNNNTVLYITSLPDDLTRPLVKGISGTPIVEPLGLDPMYDVTPNWIGSDLYLSVVRRTGYSDILGNNALGNYLDELRNKKPGDKLLNALDAAANRAEMKRVLSRSGRTNPIKLMDAPRTINTFYDSMAMDDVAFGFVARPFYVSGADFYFIGGGANVSGKISDHTIGTVGFVGGMLKYNGDYDEYNGAMYGGNIGVRYMDNDFYLRAFGTVSCVMFHDVYAFDGAHLVNDANGWNAMSVVDAGLVYAIGEEIKLIPFIGARVDYASVLHDTKTDGAARAGANLNVDTDMDGNKYAFGARVFGQSDGAIYGGIYTDMMSTVDGIGGGVSAGLLHDEIGWSYKLELNIKFEF